MCPYAGNEKGVLPGAELDCDIIAFQKALLGGEEQGFFLDLGHVAKPGTGNSWPQETRALQSQQEVLGLHMTCVLWPGLFSTP